MSANTWSILLAAIGIIGLYISGSKNKLGWAIGFFAQALWAAFAVATHQYGFIASAFAYGYVYARNYYRWMMDERAAIS
jgi:hypothetical protein